MDLTEAEDIKKRWQEYTGELYKKELHDPDNHDGMITYLYILECEVKWALEIINTNTASGADGIPVELFQILRDDAVKVLHSNRYIFSFLLCLSLLIFSQLFVRLPQTTIFSFCISFSWGWS